MRIWLIIAVISFIAGWHAHTIYDGYKREKTQTKTIEKLGEGQNEIIKFNQALDKAGKDDCFNKPLPGDIRMLLK